MVNYHQRVNNVCIYTVRQTSEPILC